MASRASSRRSPSPSSRFTNKDDRKSGTGMACGEMGIELDLIPSACNTRESTGRPQKLITDPRRFFVDACCFTPTERSIEKLPGWTPADPEFKTPLKDEMRQVSNDREMSNNGDERDAVEDRDLQVMIESSYDSGISTDEPPSMLRSLPVHLLQLKQHLQDIETVNMQLIRLQQGDEASVETSVTTPRGGRRGKREKMDPDAKPALNLNVTSLEELQAKSRDLHSGSGILLQQMSEAIAEKQILDKKSTKKFMKLKTELTGLKQDIVKKDPIGGDVTVINEDSIDEMLQKNLEAQVEHLNRELQMTQQEREEEMDKAARKISDLETSRKEAHDKIEELQYQLDDKHKSEADLKKCHSEYFEGELRKAAVKAANHRVQVEYLEGELSKQEEVTNVTKDENNKLRQRLLEMSQVIKKVSSGVEHRMKNLEKDHADQCRAIEECHKKEQSNFNDIERRLSHSTSTMIKTERALADAKCTFFMIERGIPITTSSDEEDSHTDTSNTVSVEVNSQQKFIDELLDRLYTSLEEKSSLRVTVEDLRKQVDFLKSKEVSSQNSRDRGPVIQSIWPSMNFPPLQLSSESGLGLSSIDSNAEMEAKLDEANKSIANLEEDNRQLRELLANEKTKLLSYSTTETPGASTCKLLQQLEKEKTRTSTIQAEIDDIRSQIELKTDEAAEYKAQMEKYHGILDAVKMELETKETAHQIKLQQLIESHEEALEGAILPSEHARELQKILEDAESERTDLWRKINDYKEELKKTVPLSQFERQAELLEKESIKQRELEQRIEDLKTQLSTMIPIAEHERKIGVAETLNSDLQAEIATQKKALESMLSFSKHEEELQLVHREMQSLQSKLQLKVDELKMQMESMVPVSLYENDLEKSREQTKSISSELVIAIKKYENKIEKMIEVAEHDRMLDQIRKDTDSTKAQLEHQIDEYEKKLECTIPILQHEKDLQLLQQDLDALQSKTQSDEKDRKRSDHELSRLKAEIEELKVECTSLTSKLSESSKSDEKAHALELEKEHLEGEMKSLQQQILKLESEMSKLKEELSDISKEYNEAIATKSSLETEKAELCVSIKSLQTSWSSLKTEAENLKVERDDLQLQMKAAVESSQIEKTILEHEIQDLRNGLSSPKQSEIDQSITLKLVDSLTEKNEQLEQELLYQIERKQEADSDITTLTEQLKTLKNEIENEEASTNAQLNLELKCEITKREKAETEILSLRDQINEFEKKIDELRKVSTNQENLDKSLMLMESALQRANLETANKEVQIDALSNQAEDAERVIFELTKKLDKMTVELQLMSQQKEELIEREKMLKSNEALQISSMKEHEERLLEVSQNLQKIELERDQVKQQIVEADLAHKRELLSLNEENSRQKEDNQMHRIKISELTAHSENEISTLNAEIMDLKSAVTSITADLTDKVSQLDLATRSLSEAQNSHQRELSEMEETTQRQREQLEAEKEILQEKLNALNADSLENEQKAEDEISTLNAEIMDLKSAVASINADLTDKVSQLDLATRSLSEAQNSHQRELSEMEETTQRQREQLEAEKETLQEKLNALNSAFESEQNDLRIRFENEIQSSKKMQKNLDALQIEMEKLKSDSDAALESSIKHERNAETIALELQQKIENLRGEKECLKNELETLLLKHETEVSSYQCKVEHLEKENAQKLLEKNNRLEEAKSQILVIQGERDTLRNQLEDNKMNAEKVRSSLVAESLLLKSQIDSLEAKMKDSQSDIENQEAKIQTLQTSLENATLSTNEMRSHMDKNISEQLRLQQELQKERDALEKQCTDLTSTNKKLMTEVQNVKYQLDSKSNEKEEIATRLELSEKIIFDLQNEMTHSVAQLAQKTDSYSLLEEEKHAIEANLKSLEDEVKSVESNFQSATSQVEEVNKKLKALTEEKDSLQLCQEQSKQFEESLQERVYALEKQLSESQEKEASALNALETLQNEITSRQEEYQRDERLLKETQEQLSALESERSELMDQFIKSRDNLAQSNEDLNKASTRIKELSQKVDSTETLLVECKLDVENRQAQVERLDQLLNDAKADAAILTTERDKNKSQRESAISKLSELEEELKAVQLDLSNHERQAAIKQNEHEASLASIANSAEEREAKITELEEERNRLNAKLHATECSLEKKNTLIETSMKERGDLLQKIDTLTENILISKEQSIDLEKELSRIKEDITESEAERVKAVGEVEKKMSEVQESKNRVKELQKQLSELQATTGAEFASQKELADAVTSERDNLLSQIKEQDSTIESLKSEKEASLEQLCAKEMKLKKLEESRDLLNASLGELSATNSTLKSQLMNLEQTLELENQKNNESLSVIADLQSKQKQFEEEISSRNDELRSAKNTIDKMSAHEAVLESRLDDARKGTEEEKFANTMLKTVVATLNGTNDDLMKKCAGFEEKLECSVPRDDFESVMAELTLSRSNEKDLLDRLESMKAKRKELEDKVQKLIQENATTEQKLAETNATIVELNGTVESVSTEYATKLISAESREASLAKEVIELQLRIETMKREMDEFRSEHEDQEFLADELNCDLEALQRRYKKLETERNNLSLDVQRLQNVQKNYERESKQIKMVTEKNRSLDKKLQEAEHALSELSRNMELTQRNFTASLEQSTSRENHMKKEIASLQLEIQSSKQHMHKLLKTRTPTKEQQPRVPTPLGGISEDIPFDQGSTHSSNVVAKSEPLDARSCRKQSMARIRKTSSSSSRRSSRGVTFDDSGSVNSNYSKRSVAFDDRSVDSNHSRSSRVAFDDRSVESSYSKKSVSFWEDDDRV